jgi:hypothetical protein
MTEEIPMTGPIIVIPTPHPPPKDCVVVDGHRYCREVDSPPAVWGEAILICVFALAWIGVAIHLNVDRGMKWTPMAMMFVPSVAVGLYLLFK